MSKKFKIDANYFNSINTREKAYITGLLHSDGSLGVSSKQVRIRMTDLDLLQSVNDRIFAATRKIYIEHVPPNKPIGTIVISNPIIYQDVQAHGCCISKSYNLTFPKTVSDDLVPDYLRGFFDGDGCIYVNDTFKYKPAQCSIIATENWCAGCENYLQKFNIKSKIYKDKRHDPRIASIVINCPEDIERFYNLIYFELDNELYLERKFKAFTDYILFRKMFNYDLP